MAKEKGGLGRGLDALFMDAVPVYENEDAANDTFKDTDKKQGQKKRTTEKQGRGSLHQTPRHHAESQSAAQDLFKEKRLRSWRLLSKSMGSFNRLLSESVENGYEIVAGERRWRATRKAELTQVPCLVRENWSDEQNMLFAIIENMYSEDLNPIEEAEGHSPHDAKLRHDTGAGFKSVGKSRPYIANAAAPSKTSAGNHRADRGR